MRKMRVTVTVLVALATLAGSVGPAWSWSNGPGGYNSFGTHERILQLA
jgi:hypothetical protein